MEREGADWSPPRASTESQARALSLTLGDSLQIRVLRVPRLWALRRRRSLRARRQHPAPERGEPAADRAVEHRIADAHDDAAENRRIHEEVRHDLLAVRARELLRDRATLRIAGVGGDGHVRVQ